VARKTSVAVLALALAACCAAFILTARRLNPTSGLQASCWAGTTTDGPPAIQIEYDAVSTQAVRKRAARMKGPFICEWRGYLVVAATAEYRFGVVVDDRVEIEIDHRRMTARLFPTATGRMTLTRGLHPVLIRYADLGGREALDIMWAAGTGTPSQIPAILLVPRIIDSAEIRLRRMVTWVAPVMPALCSAALLIAAVALFSVGLRRLGGPDEAPPHAGDTAILLVSVAAFGMAIWWGMPDRAGWAPDELTPDEVITALDVGFAGGWVYPPLHYAVLAAFTLPFRLLAWLGAVDLNELRLAAALVLIQRAVSLAMAVGLVAIVLRIGRGLSSGLGSRLGALTLVSTLPLAYYAKTANVDVPYLFWLALSFLFYLRAHRTGATRDYLWFAAFGGLSIATKDQAYAFYVLPAIVLIARTVLQARRTARRDTVPSWRTILIMGAIAAAVILLGNNAVLNPAAFREHLRYITGPGSQDYRFYAPGVSGQLHLLADSARQLADAMSWPLFLAAAMATAAAWRARVTPIRLLLLPVVSYYVTFIAVVGYQYDRFFLGPIVVLSLAAGWGFDRWLAAGGRWRVARGLLTAAAFAYALLRVAGLDTMMARDSRYGAEQWLLPHADGGERLAGAGNYLPRHATLFWSPMALDPAELEAARPDFVIVNVGYATRQQPGSRRSDFYAALSEGRTSYRPVLSVRTRPWWSPLAFERRFSNPREDPSSNLSKINPLIEVYAR
jgi:hypothetical protein